MAIWNDRIRSMRIQKGITLAQIAEKLGVTEATAQRYESGNIKSVPYEHMCAYGEILGCSPAYLMGWLDTADENKPTKDELTRFKANTYEALVVKEMQKMNKAGKIKLLDTARDMTCSPLYNDDYEIELKAAHERTDIEVTDEMRKHDDDIMSDDDF